MKKKFITILILTSLTVALLKLPLPSTEQAQSTKSINSIIENKIDYTEAITTKLEAIDNREIMQINLKDKFTLKGRYENDLFKNNDNVEVFAIGVYLLNSNYVIIVNGDKYIINIKLNTNIIESKISIEEDKGLLAFWDNKLTLDEAEEIRQQINDNLIKEMNSEENLKAVKERAEYLLSEKEYKVEVNFLK